MLFLRVELRTKLMHNIRHFTDAVIWLKVVAESR